MLLFKLMTNIKISLKKIEKLNTKKKDSNNEIRKKRLQPLKADIKFIILIYQFSFFQRYRKD